MGLFGKKKNEEENKQTNDLPEGAVVIGYENGIPIYTIPGLERDKDHNQFGEHDRNDGGRKSWWR